MQAAAQRRRRRRAPGSGRPEPPRACGGQPHARRAWGQSPAAGEGRRAGLSAQQRPRRQPGRAGGRRRLLLLVPPDRRAFAPLRGPRRCRVGPLRCCSRRRPACSPSPSGSGRGPQRQPSAAAARRGGSGGQGGSLRASPHRRPRPKPPQNTHGRLHLELPDCRSPNSHQTKGRGAALARLIPSRAARGQPASRGLGERGPPRTLSRHRKSTPGAAGASCRVTPLAAAPPAAGSASASPARPQVNDVLSCAGGPRGAS